MGCHSLLQGVFLTQGSEKKKNNQQENHIQINTEYNLMIYMLRGLGRKDTGDCNLLQSPAKQKELREG